WRGVYVASLVTAARGPSPLTVTLIVGHGAGVSGKPRPGRPDAAGTRGRLLDGRCRPDAWRPGVIRGRRKGASPGIIQRARGAARCGFPACPRPDTPSR